MNFWKLTAFICLLLVDSTGGNWAHKSLTHQQSTRKQETTLLATQEEVVTSQLILIRPNKVDHANMSDFAKIQDIAARKTAFYDFLLPMVYTANQEVIRERRWLKGLAQQLLMGIALTKAQLSKLEQMENHYGSQPLSGSMLERVGKLLGRVDIIPASLVIAQAAKESGWGTSRFATEANNYFGIWCFTQGCGLKPLHRKPGLTHEVATFASVAQSVRYYFKTVNTHSAYQPLRDIRTEVRRYRQLLSGDQLAQGLLRYSERGSDYVREIQTMIHYNKLDQFNRIYRT